MKFINQLMASQIGSFLKVFIPSIALMWYANHKAGITCDTWSCLKGIALSALAGTIASIYNHQNPEYKNYGRKK